MWTCTIEYLSFSRRWKHSDFPLPVPSYLINWAENGTESRSARRQFSNEFQRRRFTSEFSCTPSSRSKWNFFLFFFPHQTCDSFIEKYREINFYTCAYKQRVCIEKEELYSFISKVVRVNHSDSTRKTRSYCILSRSILLNDKVSSNLFHPTIRNKITPYYVISKNKSKNNRINS